MKHYWQEVPPTFGWTPGCKWPVVYGEHGRLRNKIVSPFRIKWPDWHTFTNENFSIQTIAGEELGIAYEDSDFGMMQLRSETFEARAVVIMSEWTCAIQQVARKTT